ncbi:MAG: hypothetical protein J6O39_03965 [Treponema sp.]|nr:hypothetical protein [Treponema sp.]
MEIIFLSLGAILNFLNPHVPASQEWYFSRSVYSDYSKTFYHYYEYGEYLPSENLFSDDQSYEAADVLGYESGVELTDVLENPAFGPQSEGALNGEGSFIPETFERKNDNTLAFFEYGEEKLSVNKIPEGTSIVSVNKNEVIQRIYGEDNLLKEKTFWKNSSEKTETPAKKIIFTYSSDEQKKLIRTFEENFQGGIFIENIYGQNGKCTQIKKWAAGEDNRKYLTSVQNYLYDEENRVTEKKVKEYSVENDRSRLKYSQRNVYAYKDFTDEADEDFYENGELRVSTKHIDDKIKNITYFFDDDFKLVVRYEHGIKVSETVYHKDTEVKR